LRKKEECETAMMSFARGGGEIYSYGGCVSTESDGKKKRKALSPKPAKEIPPTSKMLEKSNRRHDNRSLPQ
jgi:hypothetical protein